MGGSMTLINGAPGAARPEDGRPAGRGTPQSGIPTQGGPGTWPPRPGGPFSAPASAPPGSVPPPRATTPPPGAPAQRSPLVMGSSSQPGSDDDRTSLVERPESPGAVSLTKVLDTLRRSGPARWGLLGALAVLQAFVLFSAVMWWLGSSTASATANVAPQTWTGIVYDVGAAGVNLRSDPQVRPDDARDTAARGARLALQCGETGDVVAKGPVKTATWVKTTDGLFVSLLYVRVPERTSIPSCDGSTGRRTSDGTRRPHQPEAPSSARHSARRRRGRQTPERRSAATSPVWARTGECPAGGPQASSPQPGGPLLVAPGSAPAAPKVATGSAAASSRRHVGTSNSHDTRLRRPPRQRSGAP